MEDLELEERGDVVLQGKAAHAMCINETIGKMIVARKIEGCDDVLEQFNILPGWLAVHEKFICPSNGSIEAVTFVGSSILCSHINGSVVICDPHSDAIRRVQVCPSPLWSCCQIDDSRVALVSHSAILYTFNIKEAVVEKSLSLGVDTRLFSVAARGDQIAIGGSGVVYIVKDGALKHTLTVGRQERRLPTIVWTLSFLKDNVVVCGDSRGTLSFWNSDNGALLKELTTHQADILALTICGGNICASGVDPRVMTIKEVGPNDFHVIGKRNGPQRDVKALASIDDRVYIVGDDHEMFVGQKGCQAIKQQMNKKIMVGGRLVMARGANYVDLYTSGEGEVSSEEHEEILVARQPVYLARIMTPGQLPLIACDLSSDGSIIALSTPESTTAYRINNKRKKQAIARLPLEARSATCVKVLEDSILLACGDFALIKVPLEDGGEHREIFHQDGCGVVTQMDACGSNIAVLTSRLQVFVIENKCSLPSKTARMAPFERVECRLLRVDLPIDLAFTDEHRLFVLSAAAGFDEPEHTKKVLFEFDSSGGAVKRSVSAASIFGTTGVRPVSIVPGEGDRLLVLGQNGQWVIINKSRDQVLPYTNPSDNCAVHFRSSTRVCCCRIEASVPATAPFKLKQFNTQ